MVALGEVVSLLVFSAEPSAFVSPREADLAQDLIQEDMLPLRQISVEEIEPRIKEEAVSLLSSVHKTPREKADHDAQKRKERDHAIREKALGNLGFVTEGQEGDAY